MSNAKRRFPLFLQSNQSTTDSLGQTARSEATGSTRPDFIIRASTAEDHLRDARVSLDKLTNEAHAINTNVRINWHTMTKTITHLLGDPLVPAEDKRYVKSFDATPYDSLDIFQRIKELNHMTIILLNAYVTSIKDRDGLSDIVDKYQEEVNPGLDKIVALVSRDTTDHQSNNLDITE